MMKKVSKVSLKSIAKGQAKRMAKIKLPSVARAVVNAFGSKLKSSASVSYPPAPISKGSCSNIFLECPTCHAKALSPRERNDPESASKLLLTCPKCLEKGVEVDGAFYDLSGKVMVVEL